MLEIWVYSTRFNTSQRLSYQARVILKKGWFSDFETLKISGYESRQENEQVPPTRIEIQNNEK